jgi:hypothetical protein
MEKKESGRGERGRNTAIVAAAVDQETDAREE